MRFHCINVTVVAWVGDNQEGQCYRDALPVFLGREKLLLLANSRVLVTVPDAERTHCLEHFLPIFFGKGKVMLVANPEVKIVNVSLSNMGDSLYPKHAHPVHETVQHFALYTEAEMSEFNKLIHFGRVKQSILSEITGKYCADTNRGSIGQGEYVGTLT